MVETTNLASSIARGSAEALPWWKGAVIYQIYPRSFLDSNGDGVGDLKGILQGLDHIAGLGVDGIWISPFFTSPMADYGYDVADFCGVDPIFGTLADFDAIVERFGVEPPVDVLFGPAYKGIPLATLAAAALTQCRD